MNSCFVTLEPFRYEVNCSCPDRHPIYFDKGDILTLENEKRYIDGMGWYFLVSINDAHHIFMFLEDIEHLYAKGTICAIADLDLHINYLRFKINEALDVRNKESFLTFSKELEKVLELKESFLDCSKSVHEI